MDQGQKERHLPRSIDKISENNASRYDIFIIELRTQQGQHTFHRLDMDSHGKFTEKVLDGI